jgi:hypothetical protein
MSVVLRGHNGFNLTQNGGTTGSDIDTSLADFVVMAFAADGGVTPTTAAISDSQGGRTWNQGTAYKTANQTMRLFWSVGAGVANHRFTVTLNNSFPGLCIASFSGIDQTTPFDVENGAATSGGSVATGNVTPSADNYLVFAAMGSVASGGGAAQSVLTHLDEVDLVGGASYACISSYEIQTTATTRSESFTGGAGDVAVTIAAFKIASAAGFMPRPNRPIRQAVNRAGTY